MKTMNRVFLFASSLFLLNACSSAMLSQAFSELGAILSTIKTTYIGGNPQVGEETNLLSMYTVQPEGSDPIGLPIDTDAAEEDEDTYGGLEMTYEFYNNSACTGSPLELLDTTQVVGSVTLMDGGDGNHYLVGSATVVFESLPRCSTLTEDGIYILTKPKESEDLDLSMASSLATCKKIVIRPPS